MLFFHLESGLKEVSTDDIFSVSCWSHRFRYCNRHIKLTIKINQIPVTLGKHYIQYVSHQPASRVDVARLREMLDQKLMERQARESGICPVREELFSQCFDEIIRQVCLNEPERGLLLLRIRDEIKMTIAAY